MKGSLITLFVCLFSLIGSHKMASNQLSQQASTGCRNCRAELLPYLRFHTTPF